MNELTIDGNLYISSKKAAEITGYAKDYVGQLCREGHVDARMVGRSWYVLESSIRAHRFGGDPLAAPLEPSVPSERAPAATDTWEKPTYVPEMIRSMPVYAASASEEPEVATTAETLTDMQAAWKEWFAQKQDTLIESPEIIDEREEEYTENKEELARASEIEQNTEVQEDVAEPVSIQSIHQEEPEAAAIPVYEEIEEESEPVTIHHAPEVRYAAYDEQDAVIPTKQERRRAVAKARKARSATRGRGAGSFVLQAALIAVIVLVLAVTAVGTGYAARYVSNGSIAQPVLDFLGGTSTYTK